MRKHYSVIIIGAGPAGSNLARCIDSQRYDVLLIDGSEQRGEKVCGGLLSPDAQDLLAKYDISIPSDVLASPQLFSVRTIDLGTEEMQYYRRSYMNVDRGKFDAFLLDMVPDTVEQVKGICKSINKLGDRYESQVKTEVGTERIFCDYIVGADGANSVVRRCLFPQKRIQRYVAIQQWFEAQDENPFYSCVFDNETSPSCSWIFFKDGRLVLGGAFEPKYCRRMFEEQKRKLVEKGIVSEKVFAKPLKTEAFQVLRPHLIDGIWRGEESAFLIGEAGGFISPSSLEGISFALASGEYLAEAFGENVGGESILQYYKKKTNALCLKVKCKCVKRPFMYHPVLRTMVLKSGISAIKIKMQESRV